MIRKKIIAKIKRVIKTGALEEAPKRFDALFPEALLPKNEKEEKEQDIADEKTDSE